MVADNAITPFDDSIVKDMKTVMQNRAILAQIICKLHANKNKPIDDEGMEIMNDKEIAIMVVATELVAATVARQMWRLSQKDRENRPPLNGNGKADI